MTEAVVVATTRSPIGRAGKGSLRGIRADELTMQIVRAALDAVPAAAEVGIDDLVLGCGSPGGEQGWNLGRMVAIGLGLDDVPGTTVTRHCASSVQAIRMACHAIRAGEGSVFVAAGVEVASRFGHGSAESSGEPNPRYASAAKRSAAVAAAGAFDWTDPRAAGQLPDAYLSMIQTAEYVATLCHVGRSEMDEFALRSQQRAVAARDRGFWAAEITPVTLPDGTVVDADDGPREGVTLDGLAALPPILQGGRVTAGNACPVNDGAAAVVIIGDDRARELGLTPLARIVSTGLSALSPEIMGLGPVAAAESALARAGLTMSDVDLVELNEAFAAQVLPSARALGVDPERLNVNGGAIAIGHPPGMTGARLTATLINGLRETDGTIGLLALCVGGGQGMALVLERLA